MPVACYRPASSRLTVITWYLSLAKTSRTKQKNISIFHKVLLLLPVWVLAYLLLWLTLITITTGMCLINGYEIVKVRSISIKRNR